MNANDFVALFPKARSTGKGKWMTHCVAHPDPSPSLSIREGRDGRVLIKCFAGCSTDAILAALKLSRRDLFSGPPPSPERLAEMRADQEHREAERQRLSAERREALDRIDRIQLIVNALGAKLARSPDDDATASAFHKACDTLHKAGRAIESMKQSAGGTRWNPLT